jgi:hypothetical protein
MKRYYIQSLKHGGYVGDCVLWWAKNSQGYTINIDNAQDYSEQEAIEICTHYPSDYIVWDKDFIDSIVSRFVDGQHLGSREKNTLKIEK